MSETIARIANTNSRNALRRLDDMENALKSVAESTNRGFDRMANEIGTLGELASVITEMLGTEEVNARLTARREADEAARVKAAKDQITVAIESGQLSVATEVPREHALLVFTEKLADGTPLKYGSRVQFALSSLRPEVREQVVGKTVGFTFDSPEGHKFEVIEVYNIVPPKPTPAPETEVASSEALKAVETGTEE